MGDEASIQCLDEFLGELEYDDDDTQCPGHPDGPVMGETFYCDGSCRPSRPR